MSSQLMLSATFSVLAMVLFLLTGTVLPAEQAVVDLALIGKFAGTCTASAFDQILPVLQPGLQ